MNIVRAVDFTEIEKEWRRLEDDGCVQTIFQTYDWVESWWKHFGYKGQRLLLASYDNDHLTGIAPLYLTQPKVKGITIPIFKVLLPMGSVESDYNGFIFKKNSERISLISFLSFLKNQKWDILKLGDIHNESIMNKYIRESCNVVGLFHEKHNHTRCPFITLPLQPEDYLKTLSTHLKKNIRARTRKLAEMGDLKITVAPRDIGISEAMNSFFHLHETRWHAIGEKGALAGNEKIRALHADAAHRLSRYFHTAFLVLDGKKIACQYGYTFNNIRYSYLRGWDPEFKKFGVANVLLLHLIEEAIKSGIREYDFLRGNEEYKYDFTREFRVSSLHFISKRRSVLKTILLLKKLKKAYSGKLD